jgi:hypothetical protein
MYHVQDTDSQSPLAFTLASSVVFMPVSISVL